MKFNWKEFREFSKESVEIYNKRAYRTTIIRPVILAGIFMLILLQAEETFVLENSEKKETDDLFITHVFLPTRDKFFPWYYRLLDLKVEFDKV